MAREDYYAVLGVAREASPAEIKSAYRRLALDSHPDRYPDDVRAEARFRGISEAYAALGDPDRRARYDRSQRLPEALDLATPPTLKTAKELFGNVFGDVFGSRRKQRRRGRDIRYTLTVTFAQAVLGSQHRIEFEANGACSACGGGGTTPGGKPAVECRLCDGKGELKSGGMFSSRTRCGRCEGTGMVQIDGCLACRGRGLRREERAFEVRVAAGTLAGAEKILRSQGEPGRFGGEAGNLRIKINVRDDPWLERDGDDLHVTVPISISQAAQGASVAVPTVDGWVDMAVPAGAASGTRLRLVGKGVPRTQAGRGDQIVRIDVETPQVVGGQSESPAAARRARELLDALEELCGDGALMPRRQKMIDASREEN